MSAGNLLAGVVFSAIGLGAFVYGKKTVLWKPLILGVALMVYPYFIADTALTALIGVILTAALFFFRD